MKFSWLLLVFVSLSSFAQNLETRTVAGNFDTPWEILWGQDNHIWMTERIGNVNRINPETGETELLLTIEEVFEGVERGLMGMVLHPDFTNTPHVFLAYTYGSGTTTVKVVRYTYNGTTLISPTTIIDNITGSSTHDGCRMVIVEDKLFITTGDAQRLDRPQNPSSTNGKILRLNLDGTIPTDNPISGNPMWSLGHRNPQGLVYANGKLYSSEHGPNNDDEVNLIEVNRNYGWPNVEGYCDDPGETSFCNQNNVVEPMMAWTPTLAVAGLDYYGNTLIPEFENSLLMVSLKAGELTQMKLNDDGTSITETNTIVDNEFGRLRDLCISPDGRVFICTSNRDGRGSPRAQDDRIIELKPEGSTVGEKSLSEQIQVHPNPLKLEDTLTLFVPNNQKYFIGIIDSNGKAVYAKNHTPGLDGSIHLQLGLTATGVYFLTAENGSEKVVKRLVVVR